jgi:hypothetical protein
MVLQTDNVISVNLLCCAQASHPDIQQQVFQELQQAGLAATGGHEPWS